MPAVSTASCKKSWPNGRERLSLLAEMALTQKRVSEQLLKLRELHGTSNRPLSQEEAAQRVGVTHRQWQRWEAGGSMPYPRNLSRVAEAFKVDLNFFDDGRPPSPAPALLQAMDGGKDDLTERLDRIERGQDAIAQRLDYLFELMDTAADEAADEETQANGRRSARTPGRRTPGAEPPAR